MLAAPMFSVMLLSSALLLHAVTMNQPPVAQPSAVDEQGGTFTADSRLSCEAAEHGTVDGPPVVAHDPRTAHLLSNPVETGLARWQRRGKRVPSQRSGGVMRIGRPLPRLRLDLVTAGRPGGDRDSQDERHYSSPDRPDRVLVDEARKVEAARNTAITVIASKTKD